MTTRRVLISYEEITEHTVEFDTELSDSELVTTNWYAQTILSAGPGRKPREVSSFVSERTLLSLDDAP